MLRYIDRKVKEFANVNNLNWRVEEDININCIPIRIIFSSRDYAYRKCYTIDTAGISDYGVLDRRLNWIFNDMLRNNAEWNSWRSSISYNDYFYKSKNSIRVEKSGIKNVIFNDPATIVFWSDGTKTIVKAQDGDTFDPEKGLAMAISKKALGNKGNYCEIFKKWLPEEEVDEDMISYLEEKIKHLGQVLNEMNEKEK